MEEEFEKLIKMLANSTGVLEDSDTVFLMIYRKIIEKLDGVFVLCDNGHDNTSESLARDIFENYLYLAFMHKEDYSYRTKAYQYESLVNQLKLMGWFDHKTYKGRKLRSFFSETNAKYIPAFKQRKEYIKKAQISDFKNIHIDWERKLERARKKKTSYPTWYNIRNGVEGISGLSEFLGMRQEYDTIYYFLSKQVHASNALSQMVPLGEELGALTPIRDNTLKGLSLIVSYKLGIDSLGIIEERFKEKGYALPENLQKEMRMEVIQEKRMKREASK